MLWICLIAEEMCEQWVNDSAALVKHRKMSFKKVCYYSCFTSSGVVTHGKSLERDTSPVCVLSVQLIDNLNPVC